MCVSARDLLCRIFRDGTHELELATGDVGDVHVVGRGGKIFELLAGEDVDGNHVDLGVTVLASLGGGHVNNLARAALDNDVTVLPQSRALHGEGGGSAGIGGVEGVLVLFQSQPIPSPLVERQQFCPLCACLCETLQAQEISQNIPGSRCCRPL